MKTLIGIDLGIKHIGIAKANDNNRIALPLCYLKIDNNDNAEQLVWGHVKRSSPSVIVIGNPIDINGKEGHMSSFVKKFKEKLIEITDDCIDIVLWDERLSSIQADNMLKEIHLSRKKRDRLNHEIAATIILQSYIDSKTL